MGFWPSGTVYIGREQQYAMSYRDRVRNSDALTPRFRRFFLHLIDHTNMTRGDVDAIMSGAHVEVADDGRFYKLMCHDILLCERKRRRQTDLDCNTCTNVYKVYYEKARYGQGSSHKSWRDEDYPQYRLGKAEAVLPNLATGSGVLSSFDFLIGLRQKADGTVRSWFQFEAERGQDTVNSREDLVRMDNETALTKTYRMATLGHVQSTLRYGLSGRNQGPFGTSTHNDADPIVLRLTDAQSSNRYWSPITEADSVRYAGTTDCAGVTKARR